MYVEEGLVRFKITSDDDTLNINLDIKFPIGRYTKNVDRMETDKATIKKAARLILERYIFTPKIADDEYNKRFQVELQNELDTLSLNTKLLGTFKVTYDSKIIENSPRENWKFIRMVALPDKINNALLMFPKETCERLVEDWNNELIDLPDGYALIYSNKEEANANALGGVIGYVTNLVFKDGKLYAEFTIRDKNYEFLLRNNLVTIQMNVAADTTSISQEYDDLGHIYNKVKDCVITSFYVVSCGKSDWF